MNGPLAAPGLTGMADAVLSEIASLATQYRRDWRLRGDRADLDAADATGPRSDRGAARPRRGRGDDRIGGPFRSVGNRLRRACGSCAISASTAGSRHETIEICAAPPDPVQPSRRPARGRGAPRRRSTRESRASPVKETMMAAPFLVPPAAGGTIGESLQRRGVSRRALLKYAGYLGALMALPASATQAFAEGLANARRQSVIWLSFQECTGCTESLTRSFSPTFEDLIFDLISLDYHDTLQAASGEAAEEARAEGDGGEQGQVCRRCRRRGLRQGRRRLFDHRRPDQSRHAEGHGEGRARGRRGRHLRVVRRHSQGQPQSDRRGAGVGFRHRQADDQHSRLSADRRSDGRHDRLHGLVRQAAGTRPSRTVRRRSTARRSTTAATGARSTSAANSPTASTTTARGAAGASTRSAARGRSPTIPARRSNGTAASRSRSSRATAASAAPSRTSGTRAASTARCPPPRKTWGWRSQRREWPAVALGAGAAWTASRHLANRGEEKQTPEGGKP